MLNVHGTNRFSSTCKAGEYNVPENVLVCTESG